MDRRGQILKYVSKLDRGIEIAPWHAPLAPKCEGYNIAIVDVLSTEELLRRASTDPDIPKESLARIEPVDFVGSAGDLETLVGASHPPGSFDYIISSHNFEHLPNPIKFLQGCQKLLRRGGMLSMAIPDHRACFDHFRWPTTLGEWLAAYLEDRPRPTTAQWFSQRTLGCRLRYPPGRAGAFFVDDNAAHMVPDRDLRETYAEWLQEIATGTHRYHDIHCSVLTATSFRLLLAECRFLGLTDMALRESCGPSGCEFYVHLENVGHSNSLGGANPVAVSTEPFYRLRAQLIQQVADETAQVSAWGWSCRHAAAAAVAAAAAAAPAEPAAAFPAMVPV
jgi:SAM-dependent methyltransferase